MGLNSVSYAQRLIQTAGCVRTNEADRHWFAVQIRPRFEKKVAAQLALKSIDVYLPLRNECHSWSDRQQKVAVPIFPGYAFVRVPAERERWRPVLQTPGLVGFVNFGGIVTPVPASQISGLQLLTRQQIHTTAYPYPENGRRVRIRGGCLDGLEGVIAREKDKLVLSIDSIHRSLAIEIEGYAIEFV
ncbi:MAG TPA: UpxY family transcription antiterminator [Candidatus Binatia bacterium]|nr:UpxY family transcription antiterminator [Candidatus Binatia bacterium]